jgi:hypothetical protein
MSGAEGTQRVTIWAAGYFPGEASPHLATLAALFASRLYGLIATFITPSRRLPNRSYPCAI